MEISITDFRELMSSKTFLREDPLAGKYVLCRSNSAGVHCGTLISQDGDVVVLGMSRRLWSWKAKEGVALSGVAQSGIESGCKVDMTNPIIRITGTLETIVCSDRAKESIENA